MKYLLMTLALIQTCLHTMEIDSKKFVVNQDSILEKLGKMALYEPRNRLKSSRTLSGIFERLHDLKQLHAHDTRQTGELWQNPNFKHWLVWFEAELKKTIIAHTQNNNYFASDETIIHHAALHHNYRLLKFLIDIGITPQRCQYNTLYYVRNKTIAQFLIKNGEVINKPSKIRLSMVTNNFPTDLLSFYLKNGITFKYDPDSELGTALHFLVFCETGRKVFPNAKLLIEYGVPINALDKSGFTVLDRTLEQIASRKIEPEYQNAFKELETLLRHHGALTGEELQNQKNIQENL